LNPLSILSALSFHLAISQAYTAHAIYQAAAGAAPDDCSDNESAWFSHQPDSIVYMNFELVANGIAEKRLW
jgi:hypothetical protein